MVENNQAKILWDFQIQIGMLVMANQPDILVVDKQRKKATVITVPSDSNFRKKEHNKLDKYQGMKEELQTNVERDWESGCNRSSSQARSAQS